MLPCNTSQPHCVHTVGGLVIFGRYQQPKVTLDFWTNPIARSNDDPNPTAYRELPIAVKRSVLYTICDVTNQSSVQRAGHFLVLRSVEASISPSKCHQLVVPQMAAPTLSINSRKMRIASGIPEKRSVTHRSPSP